MTFGTKKPPRSVEKAAHEARIRRLKESLEEAKALRNRAVVRLEDMSRENSRLRQRIAEMQQIPAPAPKSATFREVLGLKKGYACPHCGSTIPEGEDWCEVAKANIASWRKARPEPVRG